MLRLSCPGCGSKLRAKEELTGQTRKCPKCGAPLVIGSPGASSESAVEPHAQVPQDESLPELAPGARLDRQNHYLICDRTKIFAAWENNGDGWMLRTSAGFVSAVRNSDKLPAQGDFKLVELQMAVGEGVVRLRGLLVYQLAHRWALTTLNQGDDRILGTVVGPGSLNRDQKFAVRKYLSERFMRGVWEEADAVMEYLSNTDYHSCGVPSTPISHPPT